MICFFGIFAGNDGNPSAPRNRIGQISHSVLLGTVNVGDQGDGVPDISRVFVFYFELFIYYLFVF